MVILNENMDRVGLFEPTTSALYRLCKKAADEGEFNCPNPTRSTLFLFACSSALYRLARLHHHHYCCRHPIIPILPMMNLIDTINTPARTARRLLDLALLTARGYQVYFFQISSQCNCDQMKTWYFPSYRKL